MALALALGRRGQGAVWPNPAVGCVIVKGGRIVGRGWTAPGGRPHAETRALAAAGAAARGADVYVTLEPCAHHGHTPPCAQALIDAGVARVFVAHPDPDARVSGRGFAMLRAAGITVKEGILRAEAAQDHAGFLMRTELGRPMVTLKLAASFDGRIATGSGRSKWITGPEARRMVHAMRARHDAVLVGAGTVRADNPTLNVRGFGPVAQPLRIAVSRRLELPLMSELARTARTQPVWLCHGPKIDTARRDAWSATGAHLVACPVRDGQIDPAGLLAQLGSAGLTRVFCEGGSALAASLLAADLVDQLVVFNAGLAIGAEGLPAIGALGLSDLADAARFDLAEARQIGADVVQRWDRARS